MRRGRRANDPARLRGLAAEHGVVALTDVDTRALVRRIRRRRRAPLRARARLRRTSCSSGRWPSRRSTAGRSTATSALSSRSASASGRASTLVDLGCKRSIPERLAAVGPRGVRRPGRLGRRRDPRDEPRAVLVGNGPGDPSVLDGPIETVRAPARPRAALRHLPRSPAARAGARPRDVQAPLRPPRRQPPGARPPLGPGARHRPEPRLRRLGDRRRPRHARLAERRHGRGSRRRGLRQRPVPPRGRARARSTPCPSSTGSPTRAEAHRPSLSPDRRLRADPHRAGRASSTTRALRPAACCGARATASCSSTRTRRRS